MSYNPGDMVVRESIGLRRYARAVELPLDDRMKARLGRALLNGLAKPVRSIPTTRRVVLAARRLLKTQGFSDLTIRAELARLIEEIAYANGLETVSLASGKTGRDLLNAHIADWIASSASE